jgi:biotin operon repressor
MTGCTREALSEAIGELRATGIAEVSRSHVTTRDLEALTGLAAAQA